MENMRTAYDPVDLRKDEVLINRSPIGIDTVVAQIENWVEHNFVVNRTVNLVGDGELPPLIQAKEFSPDEKQCRANGNSAMFFLIKTAVAVGIRIGRELEANDRKRLGGGTRD